MYNTQSLSNQAEEGIEQIAFQHAHQAAPGSYQQPVENNVEAPCQIPQGPKPGTDPLLSGARKPVTLEDKQPGPQAQTDQRHGGSHQLKCCLLYTSPSPRD